MQKERKEREAKERLEAAERVASGVSCICATLEPDGAKVFVNGTGAEICQIFVAAAGAVGDLCQDPGAPEGLAGVVLAGVAAQLLKPRGGAAADAEAG